MVVDGAVDHANGALLMNRPFGIVILSAAGPAALAGTAAATTRPTVIAAAIAAQPGGSVARAGIGWVDASASDQYQSVRLESHDAEPDRDPDDWADIVETPFLTNGTVGLTMVTGAPIDDPFGLAGPGLHRV